MQQFHQQFDSNDKNSNSNNTIDNNSLKFNSKSDLYVTEFLNKEQDEKNERNLQ